MSSSLAARCQICDGAFPTSGTFPIDYLAPPLQPQQITELCSQAKAIQLASGIDEVSAALQTQIAYLNQRQAVHPACKAQLETDLILNVSSSSSSSGSSSNSLLSLRAVTPLSPRPTRLSHIIDINDADDASSSSLSPRVVTEEPSASSVHATSEDELDALDLIDLNTEEGTHIPGQSGPNLPQAAGANQQVALSPRPPGRGRPAIALLSHSITLTCFHRIVTFASSRLVFYGLFFSQILRGLAHTVLIPICFFNVREIDIRRSEEQNHSEQAQRAFFIANMALDALFYARYFQWIALPLPAFLALNAASVVATAMFALHARQR